MMKPFVGCSHSDMVGTRSLREGVQQPAGKVFAIDAETQKAVFALHRTRTQRVRFRAAQIGGLRGLPAECGEVIHQRRRGITMGIAEAMAKRVDRLPALMPNSWREQWGRVGRLDEQVVEIGHRLWAWYKEGGASRHIAEILFMGSLTPKVAVASVSGNENFKLVSCRGANAACSLALKPDSVVGSRRQSPCYDSSSRLASGFDRGAIRRHFSPDTTLVRKEAGTGGHIRMLGISKRVNPCLRIWLIHGDRSVIADSKQPTAWVTKLTQPQLAHVVGVALAHKTERTNSAPMVRGREYQSSYVSRPV